MCGIIAIVRRPTALDPPTAEQVLGQLEPAGDLLGAASGGDLVVALDAVADRVERADALLRGVPGVRALLAESGLAAATENLTAGLESRVADLEADLDAGRPALGGAELEAVNASLVRVKDAVWAVRHDRLPTARAVAELGGADASPAAVAVYLSVQQALSALDRLEVRGRDSAGLCVLLRDHGLDLESPAVQAALAARGDDPLFTSGAVRQSAGTLCFTYKAAAEIGELGDNTAALRTAITHDPLLRQAVESDEVQAVVLGHTRWASVGIISQPNAHPLDASERGRPDAPQVTAVLNGDVDNFADLKATEGLDIPAEITTDAKVIPTLVSRRLAAGDDLIEAFRATVNRLEGSVAVAASAAEAPGDLLLALRGSGQALYVGVADDLFVVASEPYGVVEETGTYLRMDGEVPADPANPAATRGQVIRLVGEGAGTLAGIERHAYDGTPLPVADADLSRAQITTRDIDRGAAPHFLLKEISESPASFRKTLRGKLLEEDGRAVVRLGDDVLSPALRAALADGRIRRVLVVGQGTAAVAGQSLATLLEAAVPSGRLVVKALPATELSGFALTEDMSDTLVVAISQSGTTTDTNRTVDLVRARGGSVVAIVNRRNSDLTDRADGVLYTSDGRDVEMSVASTKAFYAQIAAGVLLAVAIATEVGLDPAFDVDDVLAALRSLPDDLEATLACRPVIAAAARRFAPARRYWAIVGNGANRIAANEVRIKLSELCYKSIASDATEDKKHIDLSSEPLILVCAAGLSGSTADDVAKEVAIYRAHKAAPIVIASEGEARFGAALEVVYVPATHPALAFVLSAMAGHLFGYEAALAIDAQARPLREARAAIEAAVAERGGEGTDDLLRSLAGPLEPLARRFSDGLRAGEYDGHLEASSAVRVSSLLRYALGAVPLDAYQLEHGRQGTPSVVVEDLTAALTRAIEELTRPVDAIKHQAKTVTVGISRSDESLLQIGLVKEVLATGTARDRLTYDTLRTLGSLDPVVEEILGYTRYRIEGQVDGDGGATITVTDRDGIGRELRSRTDDNPILRGTKHRVAVERTVLLARGRSDGRTVLLVPEFRDNRCVGITLLHVTLRDDLPLATLRSALRGYRGRYDALKDAVTETEPTFRDDLLTDVPVVDLMTLALSDLADRWRS